MSRGSLPKSAETPAANTKTSDAAAIRNGRDLTFGNLDLPLMTACAPPALALICASGNWEQHGSKLGKPMIEGPARRTPVKELACGCQRSDETPGGICLRKRAHEGQEDKAGRPYIGHVARVMARVDTAEEKIVAALHDVLEDTDVTPDDLRAAGCPDELLAAIDALTARPGEPYEERLARAAANPIALAVLSRTSRRSALVWVMTCWRSSAAPRSRSTTWPAPPIRT